MDPMEPLHHDQPTIPSPTPPGKDQPKTIERRAEGHRTTSRSSSSRQPKCRVGQPRRSFVYAWMYERRIIRFKRTGIARTQKARKKQRSTGSLDVQGVHKDCRLFSSVERKTSKPTYTYRLVQTSRVVGLAIMVLDDWQVEVVAMKIATCSTFEFMHLEDTNGAHAFVGVRST